LKISTYSNSILTLVSLFLVILVSCGTDSSPEIISRSLPEISEISVPEGFVVEEFASGLDFPTSMAFPPDGSDRLFVNELQTGRIIIFENGSRVTEPFASVNTMVEGGFPVAGENGLIGLAFDPDYNSNRFVYISFAVRTDQGTKGVVARFTDNDNKGEDFTILLDDLPSSNGHQVENIAFGPDGKLYISVGDAFQESNVQNIDLFHGKMLRMNRDGSVPADNPFGDSYVWALGLRNSFGIAFRENGDLIANENGPNFRDELNVIEAGRNYGWPDTLGISGNPDFADPIHVWNEIVAPTGIHFYKGDQFPERYRGRMFQVLFGRTFSDGPDPLAKRIQVVDLNGSGLNAQPSFEDFAVYQFTGKGNPMELTVSPDGSLFLSDIFQGKIFRIRYEN